MDTLLTVYTDYEQYRQTLKSEILTSKEQFIRIGYLLRQARDTDILKNSGYADLNEFAQAEFDLSPSTVSRFIQLNELFSEGGNSPVLEEKYRGFGWAKLVELKELPEEIRQDITPDYSKREIQTIREVYEEDQKTTPIELMMQEPTEATEATLLEGALYELLKAQPSLRIQIDSFRKKDGAEGIMHAMAPYGKGMKMVQIPQKGFVKITSDQAGITAQLMRSGEGEGMNWEDAEPVFGKILEKLKKPEETPAAVEPQKKTKVEVVKSEHHETAGDAAGGAGEDRAVKAADSGRGQKRSEAPERDRRGREAVEKGAGSPDGHADGTDTGNRDSGRDADRSGAGTAISGETGTGNGAEEADSGAGAENVGTESTEPGREKKIAPVQENPVNTECEAIQEPQIPGQMEVQDYPELMPEHSEIASAMNPPEDIPIAFPNVAAVEALEKASDDAEFWTEEQKEAIRKKIADYRVAAELHWDGVIDALDKNDFKYAKRHLEIISENIKKMEAMYETI